MPPRQVHESPVVASLANPSQHPYSSIALSPDRKHAVVAGKDNLRVLSVGPQGLSEICNVRISQRFHQATTTTSETTTATTSTRNSASTLTVKPSFANNNSNANNKPRYGDVRDTFNLRKSTQQDNNSNAVVTDVAWSASNKDNSGGGGQNYNGMIAAAGSNGVVVVWDANDFLNTTNPTQQPTILPSQHNARRAVNRLAWHPKKSTCLLSASQDATVKLWVRQEKVVMNTIAQAKPEGLLAWFAKPEPLQLPSPTSLTSSSFSWQCTTTYAPKAEAVRDIQWSPFHDDVFAMVTDGESLLIYNVHIPGRPWVRIVTGHSKGATTVDWHPTLPYVIATGGMDRTVKIWDLESAMNLDAVQGQFVGALSHNTTTSEHSGDGTIDDSNCRISIQSSKSMGNMSTLGNTNSTQSRFTWSSRGSTKSSSTHLYLIHELCISAPVTKVMWRPAGGSGDDHVSMLAVATAPIKGASAGGNGVLGLWTFHRPFMPLSIVEGHATGAVTDFCWLDTPALGKNEQQQHSDEPQEPHTLPDLKMPHKFKGQRHISEGTLTDKESIKYLSTEGTWQHVLSVGRDGGCVLQSLVRGVRPIARTSPSCFAMANLSPFQRGYGSLQFFSVHQRVPDDFRLTGLRRDVATAIAPGVFREVPTPSKQQDYSRIIPNHRIPESTPTLVFTVIDNGDLDDDSNPVVNQESLTIAPEVVHLSRFANSYKLYPDDNAPTRVDLCMHNAAVAQRLQRRALAHMWRTVASILQGAHLDGLPPRDSPTYTNAFQFVILPTMKSLLEERADAGDVQTCVALCELLQVVDETSVIAQETRIPGLELNVVREWYLSYIDLLQQMCLFSNASFLIRSCNDPLIGALNQQATTIHESCPHCGKPIPGTESDAAQSTCAIVTRRACIHCQQRIGMCFLCHEPVTGVFVWCPGCGHGGHLDHALEWFGGMRGIRETCPTGCGHKCNLTQQLNSFPRTDSLFKCIEIGDGGGE